jgi:hypothetical protein
MYFSYFFKKNLRIGKGHLPPNLEILSILIVIKLPKLSSIAPYI